MRGGLFAFSCLATGLLMAAPAAAEPAYSRQDVADFFARSAETAKSLSLGKTRGLQLGSKTGKTRGICIGLASECNDGERPTGFDLLINFGLDSAALTPVAQENLNEMAAGLTDKRLSTVRFVIEGHTDATGSEGYNDELSRRRAESVRTYLLARGIDAGKIEAVGLGERAPRVADPFDPQNRRVEMRVSLQ